MVNDLLLEMIWTIVSFIVVGITYGIYQFNKGEKSSSSIFTELILGVLYIIFISILPFLLVLAFIFLILPDIGWV
ncbi:hypothetical protein OAO74_04070 [Euryarchaeota archaeon]|jgi:hypothetical protein|nr:hypothetical protein [Euryarchaeota archaeon]MDC0555824.1 hypothetical protein [Euryarchaeota archaeon]|tara:strand:- start:1513 stop:1737 length:225 start_codon:yes stop_codon:yes gene_type:complete